MTAPLAFVDTETTGLDPRFHEVWEVALILRRDGGDKDVEYVWQLPVNLGNAEAKALEVGRFYERRDPGRIVTPERFAREFAELTAGAHLVGAVPSFDDAFLKKLLRRNGACPSWHYHLIDVEALAVGWLASEEATLIRPPWKSDQLTAALGIHVDDTDKHTALGDARWARAIYDRIMS